MITLKEISIKNFMSFGNSPVVIDLDNGLTTLICGKNGVGKTTIFQAISVALFDQGLDKTIKKDNFVNYTNGKKMEIKLTLESEGNTYIITRTRKPTSISITCNGEPYTLHSTKANDSSVEALLNLDYDLFINSICLTTNVDSFMGLTPAFQKAFMENLISLHVLSDRASYLKGVQKDVVTDKKITEQKISNIENNNERTLRSIENLQSKADAWEGEKNEKLKLLESELTELSAIDYDAELEAVKKKNELTESLNKISRDLSNIDRDLQNKEQKREQLCKEHHSLQQGKCPYCHGPFISEEKITEINKTIQEIDSNIQEIQNKAVPILDREEKLQHELDDYLTNYSDLLSEQECYQFKSDLVRINKQIEDTKSQITNPFIDQIETLKQNLQDVDRSEIDNLAHLELHYKMLIKMLTDSKSFVRKNLVGKYVPFLNQSINKFLENMDSPHSAFINDDLSVDIEYMGKPTSYGNLSNGERLRLNLATSLAFRSLLKMTGRDFNIQIVDEYFDNGGDETFMENAFKLLNFEELTVFIISHRDELITQCNRVWEIQKESGFSIITEKPN